MPLSARVAMMGAAGGGVPLSDDLLPWLQNADVFMTAITQTNFNTVSTDTANVYTGHKQSSAAQNDEIGFDIVLAAGTYTFELIHSQATNRGIYTVKIDGTSIGTIDGYAGSYAGNVRSQITGVSIASTGNKRILFVMATKNASATNYLGGLQHFQFKRTA